MVTGDVLYTSVGVLIGFVLIDLFSTGLVDVVEVEMSSVDLSGLVEVWILSSLVNSKVVSVVCFWPELVSIKDTTEDGVLVGLVATFVGDTVSLNCVSVELFNRDDAESLELSVE